MGTVAAVATLAAAGTLAATAVATPSQAATCTGYVALTFDDGPQASNTQVLLDTLKAAGARATLFNVGQSIQQYPDIVRAEHAAGMWIGNHSWTHPYLTQKSTEEMRTEIAQTQEIIKQITGSAPTLFRPPYFDTNATLKSVEAEYGLIEILADVDTQDWNNVSTDQIVLAADNLQAGGIILMHDWPANTIAAIPRIVANLAGRGLCPGMISPTTGRAVAPDSVTPPSSSPAVQPSSSAAAPSSSSAAPSSPASSSVSSSVSSSAPSPIAPSGGCTATYRLAGSWPGGYQAEVTVRNVGTANVTGWAVTMTLASGQSIQSLWNGVTAGTTGTVSVQNAAYNGVLAAGATTTFGFVGTATGSTTPIGLTCALR